MNPKREHHILPRFYLKGFVETKGKPFIWEYKKGEPFSPGKKSRHNPQWKSIGVPCATRDYYAYPHENGEVDFERIENLLEDFERPTISVLEKLRDLKTITSEEKATFSFYIVQMYRRMPRHREDLAKTFPKVLVELEPEVRENFRLPNTQETKDLFEKILERTKAPDYQTRVHLDVIANTRTSRVMKIVEGMKWRFFIAPKGQKYFTSDDPVFYFKDLGLLRSESEVSFPLSTDVALVASQSEKVREGFFPATLQIVKELNRRTASRTLQRAYFWRPEPWVLNLLNKSTYQLAPLVS